MSTAVSLPPSLPATLLGRQPDPQLGAGAAELVRGRRVLVTGAGGSIGSELVRQVSRLDPEALYLLDHDESSLHGVQLELHGHGLFDDDTVILADVRDRSRMHRVMAQVRPNLVLHAAAHKHLPLLERYPAEGVKTNVLGTANVVSAAVAAGVDRVVNVSTDKAARPTSVLGATKRVAELVVAAAAGEHTKVASVRFGNVLGSRGSLLQSLSHQVARGGPVTVTDARATRFFMTIPEASCLVLEAAAMASAGETYVLDMGTPVRILDLVNRYLAATGLPATPVTMTGLRPGEKLHEELTDAAESERPTGHPLISRIDADRTAHRGLLAEVDRLHAWCSIDDDAALVQALRRLLPTPVAQSLSVTIPGPTVPAESGVPSQLTSA